MKKAFLLILGMALMFLAACDTGLQRFDPTTGSYVEGGGSNRYSFAGGGSQTYIVPDGGFVVDRDTVEPTDTGKDGEDY